MSHSTITVVGHTDYRVYLKQIFEHLKRTRPSYSLRQFADKAGLGSKSFYKMVVDGERSLTPKTTEKFILGLGLKGTEAEYFRLLVRYNQANTDKDRNRYLEKLRVLMKRRHVNALSLQEYDYLSHWYIPVIREMIPCKGFCPKPEKIAEFLHGEIGPNEAREAISLLRKLDMVAEKGGRLIQQKPHIKTNDGIVHLAIKNYHRHMLEQAGKSIERSPPHKRELQALTIGVDPKKIPEAKKKVLAFIDEMRTLLAGHDTKQVYQLSVQLFDLTKEEFPK